ncbi:MAG: hypothetical protein U1D30_25240 [Planctomycetota bacterium]
MDPFFEMAGRSPTRQTGFRQFLAIHVLSLAGVVLACAWMENRRLPGVVGIAMVLLSVIEGALLLGWRLTQWPKSKALELLLVTSLSPRRAMLGEEFVGVTLYTFVSLSGLPILVGMVGLDWIEPTVAATLFLNAYSWGLVVGLGLVWWAYEPLRLRQWGEKFSLVGLLLYLIVGGLAGEHTFRVLDRVPLGMGSLVRDGMLYTNANNPFALAHRVGIGNEEGLVSRMAVSGTVGIGLAILFVFRAAYRLKPHYVERHYQPAVAIAGENRGVIADRPLGWWAVRRVHEYSGRINLYLAAGASSLYALFLIAGPNWPAWLGTSIFTVFEMMGGVPGLTAGLVVLAAVPAAYQFGLWESNIPDRQKRLEVLLMTQLNVKDYLHASWSAAWSRGRGYFLSALVLWLAGYYAGRFSLTDLVLAILAGGSLVLFYFAAGFRFLAKSSGGTTTGLLLSLVLPLGTWGLAASNHTVLATFLPPGQVFFATNHSTPSVASSGLVALSILATFALSITMLAHAYRAFDRDLRAWYSDSQGR